MFILRLLCQAWGFIAQNTANFLTIIGWLMAYRLAVRSQEKQHKNEINHEVYKELITVLDKYAEDLAILTAKAQSHEFLRLHKDEVLHNQSAVSQWINEVTELGTNMRFHLFLQKWESYEIFVQELQTPMMVVKKTNDAVMEKFRELFLFKDVGHLKLNNEQMLKIEIDSLVDTCADLQMYIIDFKKVLQNNFYKKYGLPLLKQRQPTDPKYKVLTEKGLQ